MYLMRSRQARGNLFSYKLRPPMQRRFVEPESPFACARPTAGTNTTCGLRSSGLRFAGPLISSKSPDPLFERRSHVTRARAERSARLSAARALGNDVWRSRRLTLRRLQTGGLYGAG